jgi:hypothetical protein
MNVIIEYVHFQHERPNLEAMYHLMDIYTNHMSDNFYRYDWATRDYFLKGMANLRDAIWYKEFFMHIPESQSQHSFCKEQMDSFIETHVSARPGYKFRTEIHTQRTWQNFQAAFRANFTPEDWAQFNAAFKK